MKALGWRGMIQFNLDHKGWKTHSSCNKLVGHKAEQRHQSWCYLRNLMTDANVLDRNNSCRIEKYIFWGYILKEKIRFTDGLNI